MVAVGGTGACLSSMQLLTSLNVDLPVAVVGLLPFPEEFLRAFVTYLRKWTTFDVVIAGDGLPIRSGVCYLAPIVDPPEIESFGGQPVLRTGCREGPSATLTSAATVFASTAIGLLLSGGGEAAFRGLAAIRTGGGTVLAQLPSTCVDPDQPQQAFDQGLIDRMVLLPHISNELSQLLRHP